MSGLRPAILSGPSLACVIETHGSTFAILETPQSGEGEYIFDDLPSGLERYFASGGTKQFN